MRASDSIPFPFARSADLAADGTPVTRRAVECMDEAAFQEFYRATAPALRSFLRRASGNASLADDILQETFYRFLRADLPALETFQMKTYLYRTANRLLADHWRNRKHERRWSEEGHFAVESAQAAEPDGETMAVFRDLKPRDQSLLWLAYVEGFDHREIAEALQLSERSVRVLLFRARGKLARILRKRGLAPEEGR